jgi:hypothetical protein
MVARSDCSWLARRRQLLANPYPSHARMPARGTAAVNDAKPSIDADIGGRALRAGNGIATLAAP